MIFKAEIVWIKSKKLASLDIGYEVKLHTSDPQVLDLGRIKGDTQVEVEIREDASKYEAP